MESKEKRTPLSIIKSIIHTLLVVSPWLVGVAILPIFILTHIYRIHQIAIIASMACALLGILFFVGRYIEGNSYRVSTSSEKKKQIAPFHVLLILVSVAMFFMFIPVYDCLEGNSWVKSFFLSIHNTMRLFVLDGDYTIINDYLGAVGAVQGKWASVFATYSVVMFVVAPVMTAGFVLSFVKDAWAHILSVIRSGKVVYYMSELNSSSIALADDVRSRDKRAVIVFFDVYHEQSEEHYEMMERAIKLGAICFRKDISAVGLKRPRRVRKFFFIGANEEENVKQAINLSKRCKAELRSKYEAELYIFATTADSELLIDSISRGRKKGAPDLKIRRIDVTKNLAISTVSSSSAIFPRAGEGEKSVDIVIIGIGSFGTELLKAYSWASQIPNCRPKIHIIDKDKDLEKRLEPKMSALLEYGKKNVKGDSTYEIIPYAEVDVNHIDFENTIKKIQANARGGIDIVYVCLGNDELNVKTAMEVRKILGRGLGALDSLPPIQAVVFSTRKTKILNENGDKDIKYIGSMQSVYSLENVENKKAEDKAKPYHMYWATKSLVDGLDFNEKAVDCDTLLASADAKINTFISSGSTSADISEELEALRGELKRIIPFYVNEKIGDNKDGKYILDSLKRSPHEARLFAEFSPTEAIMGAIKSKSENSSKIEINKIKGLLDDIIVLLKEIPSFFIAYNKNDIICAERRYNIEEYCRRSSIARAVHVDILRSLGYCIREKEQRESPTLELLGYEQSRELEHSRWNAFMRAEGYIYTENEALKSSKTKMHNLIVTYDKLPDGEKEKDYCYDFMDGENK